MFDKPSLARSHFDYMLHLCAVHWLSEDPSVLCCFLYGVVLTYFNSNQSPAASVNYLWTKGAKLYNEPQRQIDKELEWTLYSVKMLNPRYTQLANAQKTLWMNLSKVVGFTCSLAPALRSWRTTSGGFRCSQCLLRYLIEVSRWQGIQSSSLSFQLMATEWCGKERCGRTSRSRCF